MNSFKDIVGHEQVISHLKKAIAADKISHAYILDGPDRAGKMMIAEAFAAALQCESLLAKRDSGANIDPYLVEPCMECHSCRQALGKNQPDIIYLTHEKPNTISVDDVRKQLNGDIAVKPYSSRYKVYIIDEAEKMNVAAQNALLKTIEEPPAYAVILLLTTNSEMFLQTILSRCVMLKLKPVDDDKIRRFLMKECMIPDYQADLCTAFAQGVVGRAKDLASTEHFGELKNMLMSLLRRMSSIPDYEVIAEVKALSEYKDEIGEFLDLLILWFRDVLLYKSSEDEDRLIFKDAVFEIMKQADRYSYLRLNDILHSIETAKNRIKANVNFELTMELLLMEVKNDKGSRSSL